MRQNIKTFIISFILIISIGAKDTYAMTNTYAEAYIAVDSDSGRIIGSKNAEKKLPMASTTKIMTAILAIEKIEDLNAIVKIPESCVGIEGSSIYLKPDQEVSVIDLLYGTMHRSGNDAAYALAWVTGGGSVENFIQMMNEKAKELGAYNTNFVNPNGLHDKDHYTTAYDLALISQYAMKNDVFREISSAKQYKAQTLDNIIYNKNKVVHQYAFGTGIKIGYTKAAGRCLVASAKKDNTEVIVVVLNDGNWFQDSYDIFDYALDKYKSYNIVDDDQFILKTEDGVPVFSETGFSYILTDEEKDKIKFETDVKIPNNKKSKDYGDYKVYLGEKLVYTGKLISK